MFEGLDQVEWTQLWACGPATDVPRLIRTLATSTDRDERAAALDALDDRIIYQGASILEVTPYAVPFLVELLRVETVEEHTDVFSLLAMIAKGQPYLIGAGALDDYADEAAAPPELQARLAEERGWVRRSYEAIEQGVPTYLPLLAHPAADTRRFAAYLLSLLPAQAAVSVPALRARLAQEDDLLVQAALVASLADLLEPGMALPQFAQTYLLAENPLLVRCVAALAYARRAGTATPPQVVQVLQEAIAAAESVAPAFEQLPQTYYVNYYDFTTHVCETLAQVDPAQAIPALIEVLRGISSTVVSTLRQEAEFRATYQVAESLLAVAFTHGQPPSGSGAQTPPVLPLTQAQRTALGAVVEDAMLWKPYVQHGTDFREYERRQLLENFGLPAAREALRALLRAH